MARDVNTSQYIVQGTKIIATTIIWVITVLMI